MNPANKSIVTNFIKEIWNQTQFEKMDNYVSADFIDHLLIHAEINTVNY
jgi:hypothetical protein